MPFRVTGDQVHAVDFSQLGLFSITGPMGSGKSALVDAMVWCLYGRTARYGLDSKGVISTGEQTCEVGLDFTIGERWFRAVRRTGKITESGLSEREGEEWIQDTSGSASLTRRIEELLGLDFDGFTKTVILPQGRYAEFLTSEPKKRRELLAKILELGVYTRVADQAKLVAVQAKTRADTLHETLAQYAGLSQEHIALQKEELSKLDQHIEQLAQREAGLRRVAQHVEHIAGLRGRLAELQEEVQERTQEREQAQKQVNAASAQVAGLTQELAKIGQERAALGYDAARHEDVNRAVGHLKEWVLAQQEAQRKNTEQTRVREAVEGLAQKIESHTRQVEQARSRHQSCAARFEHLVAEAGDVATLTEKLGAAKRWKKLHHEQQRLTARIETLGQDHTATQHRLDDLKQQEGGHARTVRALQDQLERTQAEERQNREQRAEAEALGRELQAARTAEKRSQSDYETAGSGLTQAEQTAQHNRQALAQAETQEQAARSALEDSQRRHEAAHLRETLRVGDICPVCRVMVREIPLAQEGGEDLKTLQQQTKRASLTTQHQRAEAQAAAARVATCRVRLEAADRGLKDRERARQEAQDRFVARFPGHPSLAEALGAVQTRHAALSAALKDLEAQAASAEQKKVQLSRQRESAQQEAAKLAEALRGTTERLEADTRELDALKGELATFLATSGDPVQSVAQRRATLRQAEQHMQEAEKALHQLEGARNSLHTAQVQKNGDLRLLAVEYEGALLQAEREALAVRACLGLAEDAGLPQTEDLESERKVLSGRQTRHADLSQREEKVRVKRDQTEQQAKEAQADLQARTGVLEESQQKQGQAQHQLEKERDRLQAAIVQHHLTDTGEDGQQIKPQLETARAQMMSCQAQRGRLAAEHAEAERRWQEKEQEEEKLHAAQREERLASDLRKLLGAEFTDFLSRDAIKALMHDASAHLQRLTRGRYVFDIAYRGRAITLQIIDHEEQRQVRPTHSLSGGETFLASLALALALSQGFRTIATGRAAQTSTECLILDEGFGTLDREGVQLVTEVLQELRGEERRMVGIITHVEEVAVAMPMHLEVRKGGRTSEIKLSG